MKRFQRFGLLLLLVVAGFDLVAPATAVQASSTERVVGTPALIPKWSSAIPNYVVSCNNSPVKLSVYATPGDSVSVDGQAPQTGNFVATTGPLSAGQEFTITATSGGNTVTHYIRCLPSDFPTWTYTRQSGASCATACPRSLFYVVTPDLSLGGTNNAYVAVFDNNGVPRWWMNMSPQSSPLDAKPLPNGDLVWSEGFANGSGSRMTAEYRLDGNLVRTFPTAQTSGGGADFHDIQFLPNGNYLIVDESKFVQADLTACGASSGTVGPVQDPVLEELDPKTSPPSLVWSWDTFAHIPLTEVASHWYPNCRNDDAYHFNAIEYVPATAANPEEVLVSFRHLDAIYDIATSDGSIQWKIGGTATPESLTVLQDPVYNSGGGFGGQHDVRLYLNDPVNGFQITLHDNGSDRSRPPRAVRYRIDAAHKTATLLEQVNDPAVTASVCCGSARKLVQGNWLISWGGTGHIDELTSSGTLLSSMILNSGLFSYRVMPVTAPGGGRYSEPLAWAAALDAGMNTMHPRGTT